MKNSGLSLFLFGILCLSANSQSGVLIPTSTNKPDENILALQRMDVDILIDNNHANVKIVQIFSNKTANTLEGKYLFALPSDSLIFDFATWEIDLRIPGVMMEKHNANSVYAQLKAPKIDPAILQQDEETAAFSAKVFPIIPYGTKRLELEYTEDLEFENGISRFTFPLKAAFGEVQNAGELNIRLRMESDLFIQPFETKGADLEVIKNFPTQYEARFHGVNIGLTQDFSFAYQLQKNENSLSILTHRSPEMISAYDLRDPKLANRNPDGFFEARTIFNPENLVTAQPRRVVLLLDTSLSMHGDKLTREVEAVDYFLHNLNEADEFNLILFNDETILFSEKPVWATAETIEQAMEFVKDQTLGGGTNLKRGLETAIQQANLFHAGEGTIALISDANPTLETTKTDKISKVFEGSKAKLFAFAIGTDSNELLLKELCGKTKGDFDQARETADISLQLETFFAKIGKPTIENQTFSSTDSSNFYDVYRSAKSNFVGRYRKAGIAEIEVSADFGIEKPLVSQSVSLPESDNSHAYLPRLWARAKVDFLLAEIDRNGERKDFISEIIRLSEKYKFITPYTAFLAAPRALLRPRIIQPGDPVIRLKTDSSITEVYAVLPFGEILPLKVLADEGVWEVRFLAPVSMADGQYRCRILMQDRDGNGYQEEKTFVVDSRAPKAKINLKARTFHAGDEIELKVSSDSDTAKLFAKFYGAKPTQLFWSNEEKVNLGKLKLPNTLASGKYILTVTAEDFAHNLSSTEIEVEIS